MGIICSCSGVLTARPLPQHLNAPLCLALGFLQLALIGVGGGIRAADGSHQGRTLPPLTDTVGLRRVGRVTLTHGAEAAQHSPAACQTQRREKLAHKHTERQSEEQNSSFSCFSQESDVSGGFVENIRQNV